MATNCCNGAFALFTSLKKAKFVPKKFKCVRNTDAEEMIGTGVCLTKYHDVYHIANI